MSGGGEIANRQPPVAHPEAMRRGAPEAVIVRSSMGEGREHSIESRGELVFGASVSSDPDVNAPCIYMLDCP